MRNRKDILQDLLRCENPAEINSLRAELGAFEWDTDERLITLMPENIVHILQRYIKGEISAKEVERWADALDMREDVDMEETAYVITELANPVTPLTLESAESLISEIDTSRALPT